MMNSFDTFLELFIEAIKEDSFFNDIKIIKAYPCCVAPTLPLCVTVAVGFSQAELSPCGLGEESASGSICIFADIFSPWKMNDDNMQNILTHLCQNAVECGAVSIKAERIYSDKTTGCYVLKSAFTFNDMLVFEGDTNE